MYPFLFHSSRDIHAWDVPCSDRIHLFDKTGDDVPPSSLHPHHTLDDLTPGRHAFVLSLLAKSDMRRRLLDIGLVPGTKVDCIGRSPLGDPTAFLIRGAVIALRRKDCRSILIENSPPHPVEHPDEKEAVSWD